MKYTALFLVFSLLLLCSCLKDQKQTFEGTYGMVRYFSPVNNHVGYGDPFLINIKDTIVTMYGTVLMTGSPATYKKVGDTLFLHAGAKFFKNEKAADDFILEINKNGKLIAESYKKYTCVDNTIQAGKIDTKELTKCLNLNLISGKYNYHGKEVEFMPDGKVIGLTAFKNYSIRLRVGTLTWYDNCIIESDNGEIWKYEFFNDELILSRYGDKRDEWEHYILTNEQIRLKRV
jgi:hypothetical protein